MNFKKEMKNVLEFEAEKTKDNEGNKIINGYKIIKLLGRGSFSKIKLIEKNGKKYAMKIINKTHLTSKTCFQRNKEGKIIVNSLLENAMREIAILKKVNHKNIIKLYEIIYNNEKNKVYLILEYIEKGNILNYNEEEEIFNINENFIKENKTIEQSFYSEKEIKNIIREISLGINYLHHQGIIHRDIKPENILFNNNNNCKITDFNVSAMLTNLNDDNIGKKVEGTNLFRAPETCILNEKDKNLRGKPLDIWALGITSFIIAYRIFPFKLNKIVSPLELFENITKSKLEFPDENLNEKNINNNNLKKKKKDDYNDDSIFSYLNMYKNNDIENLNNNNIYTNNDSENLNDSLNDEEYTNKSNINLDYSDLHLSEGFKNFIRGCLEKDPNKRFTIKDILNNEWLNENHEHLTEIQELDDIIVNKHEINDCMGFFGPKNFIKNYASWAKKRIKNEYNNDNVERYKKALSSEKIQYSNLINLSKLSLKVKNQIFNSIRNDNRNLINEKSENNLLFTEFNKYKKIYNLIYSNNKPILLPKINSFNNKKLTSLEYDALKRKDFNEKLKSYNYKLMLAQKYNALQEKNKIKNISNNIYSINLKNSISKKILITQEVCFPKKISKNLSVLKIKFPEFNSLSKRQNL